MSKKTNPRSEKKQNRKKSRKNRKIVKKVKFRGSKRPLVSPGKYSSKKRHTNKNNNSVYNNTCVNQTTDKNNSKMRKLQSQNRYERVIMATCDLYDIWAKACNHYDIPEDSIRSWYERIRTKLSEDETKRVYHNWSSMLGHKRPELERAKPHIVLAAFFQYYEFDLDKNCVQENCEIFREFCRDAMIEDEDMKQIVCRLLGEKSTEAISTDVDDDMAILQDLDLLILASSPETYKNYAELSRQEWLNSGKTNYEILRLKPDSDDVPTTSRSVTGRVSSPKKKFKRSPIKSGFINKFKKIRDDQARRLLRRSRLMMQEKYKPQNGEINVCNRRKITSRRSRLAAKRSRLAEKNQQQKSQNSADTSGTSSSSANSTTQIHVDNAATNNDSDDDCVIVEDVPSHVTILDDDDTDDSDNDDSNSSDNNDINYTSAADSTDCYNSISQSFSRRFSSTPSGKKASQANTAKGSFFVDVSSKAYLGNVTYNTVAPLTGNTSSSKGNDDSTVVVVDETVAHSSGTTLQNEGNESDSSSEEEDESDEDGGDMEEDSVIFVSETNSKNFIPLNDNKEDYQSKLKNPPATKTLQYTGQHYSSLLNKNERKELQVYNSNAYNPNAGQILTSKKRMVIIDGSNVAFKHSFDKEFSVKGLTIAIAYFEKMGHEVKAVIPQFRMNQHKSTDPQEMQRLSKAGKIVLTPCKNLPGLTSTSYDDRFILQLASELDAAIVSNDNYRDLLHENTAFKKIIESRVIGYTWCNDIFLLPKDPYGKWGPTLDMILNRS